MSNLAENSPLRRSLAWAVLVLVCLSVVVAMKVAQKRALRARSQHRAALDRRDRESNRTMRLLDRLYDERRRGDGWTRADAEQRLAAETPFRPRAAPATLPSGSRETVVYRDPATGTAFQMHFKDGAWTGWSSHTLPDSAFAPPEDSDAYEMAEEFRRKGIVVVGLGWLLVVIAGAVLGRTKHFSALTRRALALATVFTACAEARTVRWLSWSSNDALNVAMLVLGMSAVLVALGVLNDRLRRERLASERVCFNCGYDMRATPDRCPECGTAAKA